MKIARIAIIALVLTTIVGLVFNLTTERFAIEGSGMEPNFHQDQMVIVSRVAYQGSSPQRGDVIIFQYPDNPEDEYIKRVIGLPGDTLEIRGDQLTINGQEIAKPYLSDETIETQRGKWNVPPDNYFVMGDNRKHSSDSRSWGMLPSKFIIGKASFTYWPPSLWGGVPQVTYEGLTP